MTISKDEKEGTSCRPSFLRRYRMLLFIAVGLAFSYVTIVYILNFGSAPATGIDISNGSEISGDIFITIPPNTDR